MAFPTGWPPPIASGMYSLRFAETGTTTANFSDNAFLFVLPDGSGNQAWSQGLRIVATTADIEFSFDGSTVHGKVPAGNEYFYFDRHEGGIAIRGAGGNGAFELEAW